MDAEQEKLKNLNTRDRFGLLDMLYFVIWFGVLSGFADIVFYQMRGLLGGRIVYLRCHMMWMTPAVNVVIIGIVSLTILPIVMLLSRPMAIRITCVVLGMISFLSILCLESRSTFSRIHFVPKVILALGLAITLQRLISRSTCGFERFVRYTTIGLILLVLVSTLIVGGQQYFHEREIIAGLSDAPESTPNVLLIVLDTVRAESMSLYGYERKTTPFLEALAEEGVVFKMAIAPSSWTLPTHGTLFTGRFTYETDLDSDWSRLGIKYPTLAEVLSKHGYTTAGFVANTYICTLESGLARGFAHYEDYVVSFGEFARSSSIIRFAFTQNWIRQLFNYRDLLGRKRASRITDDFLRWLDHTSKDHPFFAFLNYYDAHLPFLPPPNYDQKFGPTNLQSTFLARYMHHVLCTKSNTTLKEIKSLQNAYDASISYIDDDLKRLFGELFDRNLLNDTLIIIVSDHGEEFGEHGLFAHGNNLYMQVLHVPLILRLPTHLPIGVEIHKPVTLGDLPATIIDLLNLSEDGLFPGQSLGRYWADHGIEDPNIFDSVLSELNYAPKFKMKSIINDSKMHYICNNDGKEEVYDIQNDPIEHNNLIDKYHGAQAAEQARNTIKQMIP